MIETSVAHALGHPWPKGGPYLFLLVCIHTPRAQKIMAPFVLTPGRLSAFLESAWAHAPPGRQAAVRNEMLRTVAAGLPPEAGAEP